MPSPCIPLLQINSDTVIVCLLLLILTKRFNNCPIFIHQPVSIMLSIQQPFLWRRLFVAACVITAGPCVVKGQTGVTALQCEYLTAPIGIDAALPRLTWQMADKNKGAAQTACQLMISTDSVSLIKNKALVWNSGVLTTSANLLTPALPLQPFTRYFWKVILWNEKKQRLPASSIASFETGMLQMANWKGQWISDNNGSNILPAPYFRKVFSTAKTIQSARAYIAVAGLYELYINGNKTGNHRLDPMYTRFDRRTLYVSYDVTPQLTTGNNAIGVLLGNGWYNHQSTAVWYFDKAPWRNRPAFCLDLRIVYTDGSVETISSDKTWKTNTGPLLFNSIYTGEQYDARLEQPGWNTPVFEDSSWHTVILRSAPSGKIVSQAMHPVCDVDTLPARSIKKINDTDYVFDFGRNFSGVTKFTVSAAAGTVFRLRHGERLYNNGRVDISNIDQHYRPVDDKDPFATDILITDGKGENTFTPKFNYKGFQYVEITCTAPVAIKQADLTAYFMHSDVPVAGTIHASDSLLNSIWKATNSSYLSNLFGYPTDCPQREKNGWTGDAHIASETGLYNFDGLTVYEKWIADHADEQQPNGILPAIVPTGGWGYEWANGPDWTSTVAIIPYNIYLFYGDSRLLSNYYDNIKRYVDHISLLYPDGLTSWGLGDWVPVKSVSPVELTSTAYYFTDVSILAKAAGLLGKNADALFYDSLAQKIKAAFNRKYLDPAKGTYGSGTQTELSVPLYWSLVPADMKATISDALAKRVAADNYHLDVGILGAKAILNALSDNGHGDIAYKLATQESYPSWGWWIKNGATTLLENWNIQAAHDISLNHIMFGQIGAWLFNSLGGIKPDPAQPGFKHVLVEPNFAAGLDSFTASHRGPYGEISSSWKRVNKNILLTVIIPANSSASIRFPLKARIRLEGKLIDSNHGYTTASGTYQFTISNAGNQ